MIKRKTTDTVVIHCADTPADMDIGAETIRKWHVEERKWDDIGYHWVITRSGKVSPGRAIEMQGAHAVAVNGTSVGICLVGRGDNFTEQQFVSLHNLINTTKDMYGDDLKIIGHCDVEPNKPNCPGFDVAQWVKDEFYG